MADASTSSRAASGKIILLFLGIVALLAIGYFTRLTYTSYNRVTGRVDLSSFSQEQNISAVDPSEQVVSVNNANVDNFLEDPTLGPANAELTIVAFEDFQCPFCGQLFSTFRSIMNQYDDRVRFVYRDFPISDIHADAQKAAEAGQCAHAQEEFWSYHDTLFLNQNALSVPDLKRYARELNLDAESFDKCLDSGMFAEEVQQDFSDGLQAGVTGTPTLFFNGNRVAGVLNEDGFHQIIGFFVDQDN